MVWLPSAWTIHRTPLDLLVGKLWLLSHLALCSGHNTVWSSASSPASLVTVSMQQSTRLQVAWSVVAVRRWGRFVGPMIAVKSAVGGDGWLYSQEMLVQPVDSIRMVARRALVFLCFQIELWSTWCCRVPESKVCVLNTLSVCTCHRCCYSSMVCAACCKP